MCNKQNGAASVQVCEGIAQNTISNVFVSRDGEDLGILGSPTKKTILSWAVKLGIKFDVLRSESKISISIPRKNKVVLQNKRLILQFTYSGKEKLRWWFLHLVPDILIQMVHCNPLIKIWIFFKPLLMTWLLVACIVLLLHIDHINRTKFQLMNNL